MPRYITATWVSDCIPAKKIIHTREIALRKHQQTSTKRKEENVRVLFFFYLGVGVHSPKLWPVHTMSLSHISFNFTKHSNKLLVQRVSIVKYWISIKTAVVKVQISIKKTCRRLQNDFNIIPYSIGYIVQALTTHFIFFLYWAIESLHIVKIIRVRALQKKNVPYYLESRELRGYAILWTYHELDCHIYLKAWLGRREKHKYSVMSVQ